jgi:hypothetical protein
LSLLTAARADVRLASRVAGLVVGLDGEGPEGEPELGLVCLTSLSPVSPLCSLDPPAGADETLFRLGAELLEVLVGTVLLGLRVAPGALLLAGAVAPVGVALSYRASVKTCAGDSRTDAAEALAEFDDEVSSRTGAVEALAPEPADAPLELSPPVSCTLARFASADCRLALACSKLTSALCGSRVARS